ncbi:hypothetical protein [Nonomuraea dietziae]|uniref:hypothetical protein n=1 Tax=Nonomuraea dietziae TaxID=65515 RepID=UPI0031DB432E
MKLKLIGCGSAYYSGSRIGAQLIEELARIHTADVRARQRVRYDNPDIIDPDTHLAYVFADQTPVGQRP